MQIDTSIGGDGQATISLKGRFDFNTHREFRSAIDAAVADDKVKGVQLDLGGVEYLDSSALGMLLILRDKMDHAHKVLALANCRGSVRQVLDIANFGKLFNIL